MLCLGLLVVAALALSLCVGEVSIPLSRIFRILTSEWSSASSGAEPAADAVILLTLRLPTAVGMALVGASLAGAGVLFQGLLRNPLADPYVLGTSGGAALGAVVGLLFGQWAPAGIGPGLVPVSAFAGAMAAMLLVVALATVGGRLPMVTVLLAGFAVSTVLGYGTSLLLIIGDRLMLPRIHAWLLGGVGIAGWTQVQYAAPFIIGALVASGAVCRRLNALSLGEEGAARLGVDVERTKLVVLVLGSLLTASSVSVAGMIGFVGLIVPHVIRLWLGPDHRVLLPGAVLGGAAFLVIADTMARVALPPSGVPVGIVTALFGGPFFLYMLRSARRDYSW